MKQPIQHVNACSHFGHSYASVLVMRCPHLESYALHAHAWQDDDRGDPLQLWDARLEFGPFDEMPDIRYHSAWHIERAVLEIQSLVVPAQGLRIT